MSPSDENANRRRGVMCFVLFLIFVFLSFFIKDTTKNDESFRAKYWFSNEQNSISAFRQCDATDEFMYFTYQNNISRVEVYDDNGLFQYTI